MNKDYEFKDLSEQSKKLVEKGFVGENFAKFYCETNGLTFRKSDKYEEDIKQGIDCFISEIPTDVKNTTGIIFGAYSIPRDYFQVRHPFKQSSRSKNFLIVDAQKNASNFKIEYFGPISDYLLEHFFIDLTSLRSFREELLKYEFKNISELNAVSIDSFLMKLMKRLEVYLKPNAKISFFSSTKASEDCTMKLWIPDPSKRKNPIIDLNHEDLPF